MAASQDAVAVYVELSEVIHQLKARGLHESVRWAAEQLVGLPEESWQQGSAKFAKLSAQQQHPEHPKLVQGRCLFDAKVGSRRWEQQRKTCMCLLLYKGSQFLPRIASTAQQLHLG